jgi:hypothetical protein
MLPQIRQIQRLVVDSQEEHADKVGADGFANGMEGAEEEETLGCDDMSVCEYRHTGHLDKKNQVRHSVHFYDDLPAVAPFAQTHAMECVGTRDGD